MIQISNLFKTYKVGTVETPALTDVSMEVDKGEFVTVVGKSGCGKSTLLNILGLMDTFDGGEYLFNGDSIKSMNAILRAKYRNATIGFVFQMFNLMDSLTALENVEVPLGYAGVGARERKKIAAGLLESVGLGHKLKSFPRHMSGGEQQRVSIARSLANSPELILADEPTGNLDEKNSEQIMKLLARLHEGGATIIMVTHDPALALYGQKIIRMNDGKITHIELNS